MSKNSIDFLSELKAKARHYYYSFFFKDKMDRILKYRHGKCRCCGCCGRVKLFGIMYCPFFEKQTKKCRLYGKRMPLSCKNFPFDKKDWFTGGTLSAKQGCGYSFEKKTCPLCGSDAVFHKYFLSDYDIYKCDNCGAVITNPDFYNSSSGKNIYSEKYFNEKYPKRYSSATAGRINRKDSFSIEYSHLLEEINSLKKKGTLLDIGCSTGVFLHLAKEDGWKVRGIETSKYASKYARKNFKIQVINSPIEEINNYSVGKFDVVTLLEVIEHVKDPVLIVRKTKSLLKKEGLLVIKTIDSNSLLSKISALLYWTSIGKITMPLERCYQSQHTVHFSFGLLENILESNGFQIVSLEKTEIPLDKLEEGNLMKTVIGAIYFFQKLFGMQFEFYVFAKKKGD